MSENARDVLETAIRKWFPRKTQYCAGRVIMRPIEGGDVIEKMLADDLTDKVLAALAAAGLAVVPQDAIHTAVIAERDRCILIASRQEYYPHTHTGLRQQWVKEQIMQRILAGVEQRTEK